MKDGQHTDAAKHTRDRSIITQANWPTCVFWHGIENATVVMIFVTQVSHNLPPVSYLRKREEKKTIVCYI